jgi:hypothetical protein
MANFVLENIRLLRNQIPIGVTEAKQLLGRIDNVATAIQFWKQEQIEKFCTKTQTDNENASVYLDKAKWLLNSAIDLYWHELLTLIEQILRSSSQNDFILSRIREAIDYKQEGLSRLPKYEFEFVLLSDWLDYLDWEGYDYAIKVNHIQQVIEILNLINATEFAFYLNQDLIDKTLKGDKFFKEFRDKLDEKFVNFVRENKLEFLR